MSYKLNGSELTIPLAVSCIEDWIAEKRKELDLENKDDPKNLLTLQALRGELYRDTLIAVRGRAAHGAELAAAALKLEELLG